MKIIKIGTWTTKGMPTGWTFDLENSSEGVAATDDTTKIHCLGIKNSEDQNCPVTVNGIEIIEWTKARKAAMAK